MGSWNETCALTGLGIPYGKCVQITWKTQPKDIACLGLDQVLFELKNIEFGEDSSYGMIMGSEAHQDDHYTIISRPAWDFVKEDPFCRERAIQIFNDLLVRHNSDLAFLEDVPEAARERKSYQFLQKKAFYEGHAFANIDHDVIKDFFTVALFMYRTRRSFDTEDNRGRQNPYDPGYGTFEHNIKLCEFTIELAKRWQAEEDEAADDD